MDELEKTFLARKIPEGLENCKCKEMIDVYFPNSYEHPVLRLRKDGYEYELTKKTPINEEDSSHQEEQTITLDKDEFDTLNQLEGKEVRKVRYYHEYNGYLAEIDVFKGPLKGLVLVDFEFETIEEKENFEMPSFCLADVTQEKFVAGGMLCGKSYEDIEEDLRRYNYEKLFVD